MMRAALRSGVDGGLRECSTEAWTARRKPVDDAAQAGHVRLAGVALQRCDWQAEVAEVVVEQRDEAVAS
jgi:hypothetical protein